MQRFEKIKFIRMKLKKAVPSIGCWMQIPNSSVAEIMGQANYDWVAVDLEHGAISVHQLPDLFRALELGKTLPLVRLAEPSAKNCKQALDAGAGGVIVPMVESAAQLESVCDACRWPPAGSRGVGFSRANLFGKHFKSYSEEAQAPIMVAQLEHIRAVENLDSILSVEGLDAVFIGPYDLSASMGLTGKFKDHSYVKVIDQILGGCRRHQIAGGIHIIEPNPNELQLRLDEGYLFIAYSIDGVFLNHYAQNPLLKLNQQ